MKSSRSFFSFLSTVVVVSMLMSCKPEAKQLVILHTNDTHSQVEPKADGTAGYARRMGVIEAERKANPCLLLVDAGDFCQGTPYFNYFHGRIEIDALNRMGYDVATLGNHEFDNGLDSLAMLLRLADFPIVCANYDVAGSVLEGLVKPYTIVEKDGVRIGIFGLGVSPDGLISMRNFLPLHYLDPLPIADSLSTALKLNHHCDVVVCLSHLGTHYDSDQVSDEKIASGTSNIDVIIGGHTHKMFPNHKVANANGDSILLSQMGKSGTALGKITLTLD